MASYQDLETRIITLEQKIEFVMRSFTIQNPLSPFGPPKSLLKIYYEVVAGIPLDLSVNGPKGTPDSPSPVDEPLKQD